MNSHSLLVSVIIPAYNAELYIGYTLDSVISQTYQNIEVIIVDDGSQDKTVAIVKSYITQDPRIILIQQANAGVAAARNRAIQAAHGDYIAPLDADDIWYPQKLEKQIACFLQSELSVGMVYVWTADIDVNNRLTGGICAWMIEGDTYIPMIYSNFLGSASCPLIRRDCFERVGGYNSRLKALNAQGCEDWDLYLRIADVYHVRVVPELLIGYRQSSTSMSTHPEVMQRSFEIMMEELQQRHPAIPQQLLNWATSHYYCGLAERTLGRGDYLTSLMYLVQAIQLDYLPLLYPGRYRLLLTNLQRLLTQPLVSVMRKMNLDSRGSAPTLGMISELHGSQAVHSMAIAPTTLDGNALPDFIEQTPSLEALYQKIHRRHHGFLGQWRNALLQRRWQKITQLCSRSRDKLKQNLKF
jgi:glycosyltransferase involved in cell wall biosynthesis